MLGGATLALAGCPAKSDDSARAVLGAIELARAASPADKAGPAEALAKLVCASPDVCAARDACAPVFRAEAEGVRVELRARADLAALDARVAEGGAPDAPAVLDRIAEQADLAKAKVREASAGLPACERAVLELRRAHRL